MKHLLLAAFLFLAPVASAEAISRGSLCHDQVCWDFQQRAWETSMTRAQARYSHNISKMLVDYIRLGHPQDDFVAKRYAKIHNRFVLDMRAAGRVWFFEVQGYDLEHAVALEDNIVSFSETSIDQGLLNAWFFGVYQ